MESKYYTPDISEFYVGFEYYFASAYSEMDVDEIDIDGKEGYLLESFDFNRGDVPYKTMIESWLKYDQVKVKYLNREDIESLGWVIEQNMHTKGKFKLLQSPNDPTHIRIWTEEGNVGYSDIIFEGTIKNKSELKKLLLWLSIIPQN